jgi:hypothetical protein
MLKLFKIAYDNYMVQLDGVDIFHAHGLWAELNAINFMYTASKLYNATIFSCDPFDARPANSPWSFH